VILNLFSSAGRTSPDVHALAEPDSPQRLPEPTIPDSPSKLSDSDSDVTTNEPRKWQPKKDEDDEPVDSDGEVIDFSFPQSQYDSFGGSEVITRLVSQKVAIEVIEVPYAFHFKVGSLATSCYFVQFLFVFDFRMDRSVQEARLI
jgi:hypothetical protein